MERQQLKWFGFAGGLAFATILLAFTPVELGEFSLGVGLVAVPIATGVAILKYRLYDIDRIINKALVFGLLSTVLVAGYAGAVLLLQTVLPVAHGSPIAVAGSTLAMAALFGPLRRRIQSVVDRRFYRSRYDATRTVEAFGSRLRQQTNLEEITDDLGSVVRATLRPSHVSVWLSRSGTRG